METDAFSGVGELKKADTFSVEQGVSELYFDRIWFSKSQHATIIASDIFSTGGKLPTANAQILLKLSTPISGGSNVKSSIKITADNASFTGFSATQSGTTVKINLPTLNEGVTYRLSLSEGATDSTGNLFADIVPIEFSTYNSDSKAENLVLKDSTGNTVTSITGQTSICAEAELEPVAGDKLTLIVAAYGSGVPKAVGFKQGSGTVKTDLISLTSADSVRAWIILTICFTIPLNVCPIAIN